MTPLFRKLQLKQPSTLLVLQAPASFEPELALLPPDYRVLRQPAAGWTWAIGFATTHAELDAVSQPLVATPADDPQIWLAYPKQSSKRLRCEFNRDGAWTVLAGAGFEPVSQVAIDSDWSALRFRRVQHIARFQRGGAISEEGKRRLQRAGG